MPDPITIPAPHGQRMIVVSLHFWTNGIAPTAGEIIPKVAYAGGYVRVEGNDVHGITPQADVKFNSEAEIPAKIEKALIQAGVKLVRNANTTIPAWTNADGPEYLVNYLAAKVAQ